MSATLPAFDDLVAKVRRVVRDDHGNYWTDDEIKDYLNEGQREFVRQTFCLRAQSPITAKENEEVYLLPDGCREVLRMENTEGTKLEKTTSHDLQAQHGDGWRDTTGTPEAFYSDLDGDGKFRFYPRPVPSVESSLTAFDATRTQQIYEAESLWAAPYEDKLAVMTPTELLLLDSDYNVISKKAHGLTVTMPATYLPMVTIGTIAGIPYWFYSDGTRLCKCAVHDGTPTSLGVFSGAAVEGVFGVNGYDGDTLYFLADAHFYSVPTVAAYAETDLGAVGGTAVSIAMFSIPVYGQLLLAACGASGLKAYSTYGGAVSTLDAASCTSVAIAREANQGSYTVYYARGALIYKGNGYRACRYPAGWPSRFQEVATTLAVSTGSGYGIAVGRDYIYFISPTSSLVKYDLSAETLELTFDPVAYNATFPQLMEIFNGRLVHLAYNQITTDTFTLNVEDADLGSVFNMSDTEPDQEYGEVIEYNDDSEASISFSSEEGVVVGVLETEDQATVFYVRDPKDDTVEVTKWPAVIDFALYRCYEKDEDRQNLAKSQFYFSRYMLEVAKERRKAAQGYNRSGMVVTAHYF